MKQFSTTTRAEQLEDALELMRAALATLDDANAPFDVGAHLDLAISRLEVAMHMGREAA